MGQYIWDLECDGLLDTATKIHCIILKELTKVRYLIMVAPDKCDEARAWAEKQPTPIRQAFTVTGLDEIRSLVGQTLIGHNTLGFDVHAVRKLIGFDIVAANHHIDTLVLSRHVSPDRQRHSLEFWGEKLGWPKVGVEDWKDQPLSVYLDRCLQDVAITEKVAKTLAPVSVRPDAVDLAHHSYYAMCKQERDGAVFNRGRALNLLRYVAEEMGVIQAELEPQLGRTPLPMSMQPKLPKKRFNKKTGKITAFGRKYGAKVGVIDTAALAVLLSRTDTDCPVLLKKGVTLADIPAVKAYMHAKRGWHPTIWRRKNILVDARKQRLSQGVVRAKAQKYLIDVAKSPYCAELWSLLSFPAELRRHPNTLEVFQLSRAGSQVIAQGRDLPTTPQFQDPVSKRMCPNLEELEGEFTKKLLRWLSLRNRRGVLTTWVTRARLKVDGRLSAGSAGLTNTHRQRHRVVVNVPKADPKVVLGGEMRALFHAPDDMVCVGCDLSGVEARLAGHYAAEFDGGDYLRSVTDGDIHTKNASAFSEAAGFSITRSAGKPITYAIMYGAGVKKVASMLKTTPSVATRVRAAFWDSNDGLKKVNESLMEEWHFNDMNYIQTLDGRHVPTRSPHSLLNCLIQSSGSVLLDRWWEIALKMLPEGKYQRWLSVHDELQLYADSGMAPHVGQVLVDAARLTGEFYKLRCVIAAEYKTGWTWADTH